MPQAKTGRNDPCPCGSGRKYKQCCRQRIPAPAASARAEIESAATGISAGQRAAATPPQPGVDEINALVALFSQGRYGKAEALARDLTGRFPQHGFGWKVLGVVLLVQGRSTAALDAMQKAAVLLPKDAELHGSLGRIYLNLGRYDDAAASCRSALGIQPDLAEAHNTLGLALKLRGHLPEAEASLRRALEIKPDFADAHNNLSGTLKDMRRFAEAEASLQRALEIKPDFIEAHNNLGLTLREQGRHSAAEASFRQALKIRADFAEAHCNLGLTLYDQGRLDEAEASYRRALNIRPDFAEAHCNLGATFQAQNRLDEADASYRRALEIHPRFVGAYISRAVTLGDQGRLAEAEASLRQALEIDPESAAAHNNLGGALSDLGRFSAAEASYRRALEIRPDYAEALGNLLFVLNYTTDHPLEYRIDLARRYGRLVDAKVGSRFTSWECPAQPERLRVGLVSGDLRGHPVGFFLEGLLTHLDPARVELIAYPTHPEADELTARIRPFFAAWRPLFGLSDAAAARLIHADGVHILMDLAGHTDRNRLPVFAWKPAPVQASWLGYLATTGMAQMDYVLADPYAIRAADEANFVESVWRLPASAVCFTPPAETVAVAALPALASGCITFGSFNNLSKTSEAVVAAWSRILHAVPTARLFLKTRQLNDPAVRAETLQRFASRGVAPGRVLLGGKLPTIAAHLAEYHRVDIALDTFPYHGATTSIEALWMGVPVLTLQGDGVSCRTAESIARNAGLADWVAEDEDDYVARAARLAADAAMLTALRAGLRAQVLASPLFDAARFARDFAEALWGMWKCRGEKQTA